MLSKMLLALVTRVRTPIFHIKANHRGRHTNTRVCNPRIPTGIDNDRRSSRKPPSDRDLVSNKDVSEGCPMTSLCVVPCLLSHPMHKHMHILISHPSLSHTHTHTHIHIRNNNRIMLSWLGMKLFHS